MSFEGEGTNAKTDEETRRKSYHGGLLILAMISSQEIAFSRRLLDRLRSFLLKFGVCPFPLMDVKNNSIPVYFYY